MPLRKDKGDAGQARAIRDARQSAFWSTERNRQERFATRFHNASGSSVAAIPVHATSLTRIGLRRFCYTL